MRLLMGLAAQRRAFYIGGVSLNAYAALNLDIAVDERLITLGTKIIEVHGDRTIGVKSNVCGFVNHKVIAWTLTDNVEPVDERHVRLPILERSRKTCLSKASRPIPQTSGFAGTGDTLRLKMQDALFILKNRLLRKNREKCKNAPNLLGMPSFA